MSRRVYASVFVSYPLTRLGGGTREVHRFYEASTVLDEVRELVGRGRAVRVEISATAIRSNAEWSWSKGS